MAKWDTVLAIALALTAGALIAVRRSAIERVLSASEITVQCISDGIQCNRFEL